MGVCAVVVAVGTSGCSTKEVDCEALLEATDEVAGDLEVDLSDDTHADEKLEKMKKARKRAKKTLKKLKKLEVKDEQIGELAESYEKTLKKVEKQAGELTDWFEIGVKNTEQLTQMVTAVQAAESGMKAAMREMSSYELRRLANALDKIDRQYPGTKPAEYYDKTATVVAEFKARRAAANTKLAAWAKSLRARAKAMRDTKGLQESLDRQAKESEEIREAYTEAQDKLESRFEAIEDACEE